MCSTSPAKMTLYWHHRCLNSPLGRTWTTSNWWGGVGRGQSPGVKARSHHRHKALWFWYHLQKVLHGHLAQRPPPVHPTYCGGSLLLHFQPRHKSSSELKSSYCPGSFQHPKSALSPIILCFGSGGKSNQHPLAPPVHPHFTESLKGISCYDPIWKLRTLRLQARGPAGLKPVELLFLFPPPQTSLPSSAPGPFFFLYISFYQTNPWHLNTPDDPTSPS